MISIFTRLLVFGKNCSLIKSFHSVGNGVEITNTRHTPFPYVYKCMLSYIALTKKKERETGIRNPISLCMHMHMYMTSMLTTTRFMNRTLKVSSEIHTYEGKKIPHRGNLHIS